MDELVGQVQRLFRYPVKSLQGFEVDELVYGARAARGDREHALIDAESGALMSAKRYSRLFDASADDEGITLPDGERVPFDAPDVDARLGTWLGREVQLRTSETGTHVSYEMTFNPPDDDAEYYEIPSPEGTFLDLASAHLISTGTLDGCADARSDLDWDVRRFRPNLVVDGPTAMFGEDEWCGQRVQIGGAVFSAVQPTVRCAMPLRAQPGGLERQPALYKALEELHLNHLGIYLDIVEPGTIRRGDDVRLLGPIDAA